MTIPGADLSLKMLKPLFDWMQRETRKPTEGLPSLAKHLGVIRKTMNIFIICAFGLYREAREYQEFALDYRKGIKAPFVFIPRQG